MSVFQDLRDAQQRALDRLKELEPLVAEYEQLRQEVERLGLTNTGQASANARGAQQRSQQTAAGGAATAATRRSPSRRRRSSSTPRTRQPGGSRSTSRAEDIARLVAQNPGLTVRDLGGRLGVDPTGLYRPVRRLVDSGQLRRVGRELHPSSASRPRS